MSNPGEQVSFLIYGPSKKGKSTLAATAPGLKLLLDAESGGRFLRGKKTRWNPLTDAPPEDDGTWEICIVVLDEYKKLEKTVGWLESGQHPFDSVIVDSISDTQAKFKEKITGSKGLVIKPMDQQKWGHLLESMRALMGILRDFTEHPTKPLNIIITAKEHMLVDKYMPMVEGKLKEEIPFFTDVVARMDTQVVASSDPTAPNEIVRFLTTQSDTSPQGTPFFAGERVGGKIPMYVYGDDLNISRMIDMIWADDPAHSA